MLLLPSIRAFTLPYCFMHIHRLSYYYFVQSFSVVHTQHTDAQRLIVCASKTSPTMSCIISQSIASGYVLLFSTEQTPTTHCSVHRHCSMCPWNPVCPWNTHSCPWNASSANIWLPATSSFFCFWLWLLSDGLGFKKVSNENKLPGSRQKDDGARSAMRLSDGFCTGANECCVCGVPIPPCVLRGQGGRRFCAAQHEVPGTAAALPQTQISRRLWKNPLPADVWADVFKMAST